MNYAKHLATTQREPMAGQVPNSGGGFSFPVDDWTQLDRFLVLGAEGGSYYATERKLTKENAAAVMRCIEADGQRAVARIVEISDSGRAPKNDPALFALALAAKRGDLDTRRAAFAALPRVARIGTHLFHFAEYVKALGGWGRGTTGAIRRWYLDTPTWRLTEQAIKYQQRDGWAHRDLLRKAHPKTTDAQRNSVFHWMVKGWPAVGTEPHPDQVLAEIWAFERARAAKGAELVRLVEEYQLPHECVPNEAKGDPAVWAAMLPSMGTTALIRNLGKMTAVGLLKPMSDAAIAVAARLQDADQLGAARVHPLQVLVALRIYARGAGDKGSLTWTPVQQIVDALDSAFYLAFKAVEPTGKRTMLALDISSSMCSPEIAGMSGVSPRVGSAAMALITANTESNHLFTGFHAQGLAQLEISPRQRLDDVVKYIDRLPFGSTDCALPMLGALQNKVAVDTFIVYTDSETNARSVRPVEALRRYRQAMGIPAKLIVVGMVSNGFSIADANDGGMLDVVGFDSSAPAVMADFARA